MKEWKYYFKGYLHIRLLSNSPERFLNMCANHQIDIWDLAHVNEYYEMNMTIQGFYKLQPLCRKTKSRILIKGKYGLPFFFYKNKKRKAFFIGILLCISLVYGMSRYIWNIHVDGNLTYSTQSILLYLDELDIHHGIKKSLLDCSDISAKIRKEFPDIIWVSTKIQGTRLVLDVQENTDRYNQQENNTEPSDIIADKSGKIVSMVTRSGVPLKSQGDTCEKGDTLVLGRVDIIDDSGEAVNYQYVPSDADIYIETTYQYYQEFPLNYEKRSYTDKKKESHFMQVFDYYLSTKGKAAFPNYDCVAKGRRVRLTENFYLPITYGTTTDFEYIIEDMVYSQEEATAKATKKLSQFLDKLKEKGVEICDNRVKIEVNDSTCISKGSLTVILKAGESIPTEQLEPPAERTPETDE